MNFEQMKQALPTLERVNDSVGRMSNLTNEQLTDFLAKAKEKEFNTINISVNFPSLVKKGDWCVAKLQGKSTIITKTINGKPSVIILFLTEQGSVLGSEEMLPHNTLGKQITIYLTDVEEQESDSGTKYLKKTTSWEVGNKEKKDEKKEA